MNLRKTLTVGLLALALPGMASAQTVIHIAGSTAFRAPVSCAIIHYLATTAPSTPKAIYNPGGASPSLLGGTAALFSNGTISFTGAGGSYNGTATVIIEANWTGSLAGVVDLATQNTNLQYYDITNSGVQTALNASTANTSPFGGGTNYGAITSGVNQNTVGHAPDVVMSDSFYTSVAAAVSGATISGSIGSITVTPNTGAGLKTFIKNAHITEAGTASPVVTGAQGYLGIVPFQWVLGNIGNGTTIPFTNITQQAASFLIQNGGAPLTMFSTNKADNATANSSADFVWLVGRNEDSGTRIEALAEPQLGFLANPQQMLLTFTGGTILQTYAQPQPAANNGLNTGGSGTFVTDFGSWTQGTPLNTEANISWPNNSGHGGYVSGGDVATVLSTPVTQGGNVSQDAQNLSPNAENTGNVFFMGYISIADSGGYVAPGTTTNSSTNTPKVTNGTCLSFNGVPYSPANVLNGSYSFWCYEHMYYLTSGTGALTGTPLTTVNTIANSIASTYVDYNSSGVSGSGVTPDNGAGIAAPVNGVLGTVTRTQEGGVYDLNY